MTLKESVEGYILGLEEGKSREKCNNTINSKILFFKMKITDKIMAG